MNHKEERRGINAGMKMKDVEKRRHHSIILSIVATSRGTKDSEGMNKGMGGMCKHDHMRMKIVVDEFDPATVIGELSDYGRNRFIFLAIEINF